MELIAQQFPIVIHSLNIGFLQTLKLFFITLLGALPLGLVTCSDPCPIFVRSGIL